MKTEHLKRYWAEVRAGRRPKPVRKPRNGILTRKTNAELPGGFGPDKGKRIVVTIHPNGIMELKPERTRRSESIDIVDVYRYALRCRVGRGQLEKARERKAKKAVRLARQRQERAEKRFRKSLTQP